MVSPQTHGLFLIRPDSCNATGDQWCLFNSFYNKSSGNSLVDYPMTIVNPGHMLYFTCMFERRLSATFPDIFFVDSYNSDHEFGMTDQDLNLEQNATVRYVPYSCILCP